MYFFAKYQQSVTMATVVLTALNGKFSEILTFNYSLPLSYQWQNH
jgi:hypothetical protein